MKQITRIVATAERQLHIWERHGIVFAEVEEACFSDPLITRGREGCHVVFGRTEAGRFLYVVVVMMSRGRARLITARAMMQRERRFYQRRGK